VGDVDGALSDGDMVGITDGDFVGEHEGCVKDGDCEGFVVGPVEGSFVGMTVGAA
jgi:hypothetical protein